MLARPRARDSSRQATRGNLRVWALLASPPERRAGRASAPRSFAPSKDPTQGRQGWGDRKEEVEWVPARLPRFRSLAS